jgi:hypothetical protein
VKKGYIYEIDFRLIRPTSFCDVNVHSSAYEEERTSEVWLTGALDLIAEKTLSDESALGNRLSLCHGA